MGSVKEAMPSKSLFTYDAVQDANGSWYVLEVEKSTGAGQVRPCDSEEDAMKQVSSLKGAK